MHKRQQGFLLLGLLISLGVLSAIFLLMAEGLVVRQIRAQAEPFKERMIYIKEQIDGYQLTKYQENATNINGSTLFPRTLDDLSPNYIPTCSTADNQNGLCAKTAQTPWGTNMTYKVSMDTTFFPPRYYAELTLALPSRTDDNTIREYNVYAEVLSILPGIRFSADEQSLIWKIPRLVDIPNFEAVIAEKLKDYINKDGTTKLTADWDVGNKAILNTSMVTSKGANGKQVRIDGGVVKRYSTLIGGNGVYTEDRRFTCANGLYKDVKASFNGIKSPSGYDYLATGEIKTYTKREGAGWRTRLTYKAKQKLHSNSADKGRWYTKYDGYVDIIYLCVPEL